MNGIVRPPDQETSHQRFVMTIVLSIAVSVSAEITTVNHMSRWAEICLAAARRALF
jgi:hypothetical protein